MLGSCARPLAPAVRHVRRAAAERRPPSVHPVPHVSAARNAPAHRRALRGPLAGNPPRSQVPGKAIDCPRPGRDDAIGGAFDPRGGRRGGSRAAPLAAEVDPGVQPGGRPRRLPRPARPPHAQAQEAHVAPGFAAGNRTMGERERGFRGAAPAREEEAAGLRRPHRGARGRCHDDGRDPRCVRNGAGGGGSAACLGGHGRPSRASTILVTARVTVSTSAAASTTAHPPRSAWPR